MTAELVFRLILGTGMIIFPVNALFLKVFRPQIPEKGALLMQAFQKTGYMLPLIQFTELIAGVLLVLNAGTPLVLLFLLPVTLNIFLFHLFLAPPILGPGPAFFFLNAALIAMHYETYLKILV